MAQAGNPTNATNVDRAAAAQSVYLGDAYATIKRYLIQWEANAPNAAALTALGYTDSSAQAQILSFQENLATLVAVFEGSVTTVAPISMIANVAQLRGVDG